MRFARPTPPSSRRGLATGLVAISILLLQACASAPAQVDMVGKSQEAVVRQLGTPIALYQVGEHTHWFYNRGGQQSERDLLIFNAQGEVETGQAVWFRDAFETKALANLSSLEILQRFGPPLQQGKQSANSLLGLIQDDGNEEASTYWQYAFKEYGQFFNVHILFNEDNRVTDVLIQRDIVNASATR